MQPPVLGSTGQYIAWYARYDPETTAIVGNGANITYWRLARDLRRCIRGLSLASVGPGTLAGVHMTDRYSYLLLVLACEVVGATATPLVPADLADGEDLSRHCGVIFTDRKPTAHGMPKTFVLTPDWLSRLRQAKSRSGRDPLTRAVAPEQIVRIVRTSGTTGRPKAMPMTHVTQQLRVIRTIERVAEGILPRPQFLCLYGLYIGSVYVRALGVLQNGGTIFLAIGDEVKGLIGRGAVNYANFTPGDIEGTVRHGAEAPVGHKMQIEVFGATVLPALRHRIRERLHATITNKYSSNETNPISIVDDDGVGTVCPGVEVRVVDAAGNDVPAGQAGRIRVRSETMVREYYNEPELTAASFIDGWFQTNDLGRVPEPGKLTLLGRVDDMLNIGGVKVAPMLIELALRKIDGVRDAAVVSTTNEYNADALLAVVEVADTPPADLDDRIGAIMSECKLPFQIRHVAALPRTETGKVKRRDVAAAVSPMPAA